MTDTKTDAKTSTPTYQLLIDMDGVLCRTDEKVVELMKSRNLAGWQTVQTRTDFDALPPGARPLLAEPGFFSSLLPMEPNLPELFTAIEAKGWDIHICTSPIKEWNPCIGEKADWARKHLGEKWLRRLIITKDKTLVGSSHAVLLDDRFQSGVVERPPWLQLLFGAYAYNQSANVPYRVSKWNDVLPMLEKIRAIHEPQKCTASDDDDADC